MLLEDGQSIIDVIEYPNTTLDVMKQNLTGLTAVAQRLNLTEAQSYLVLMWLKYVKKTTFQRQQDINTMGAKVDGTQLGVMSQLTSQNFAQMASTMEQEVPHIIYTYQFAQVYDWSDPTKMNCTYFYQSAFGFDAQTT